MSPFYTAPVKLLSPELTILKQAIYTPVAWAPCTDPYTMDGYTFSRRQWTQIVRELRDQDLIKKLIYAPSGGLSRYKGKQKTLTCYILTSKGRKVLEHHGVLEKA